MLQDLYTITDISISFSQIVVNLSIAFLCGLVISVFYRKSYKGPGYLNSFVNSLVILSVITAIVIMLIGNNLARAFGLVGAMSIIRFRTAVKETQDIIFIFFSLTIGMAVGVGLHLLAIFGTFFVGIITMILTKSNFFTPKTKDYLLQIKIDSNADLNLEEIILKYCKRVKIINLKSIDKSTDEYSFYVGFRKSNSNTQLIKQLKSIEQIRSVNLFYDEEYF